MGTANVEHPSVADWTMVLSGAVAAGLLCALAILLVGDISGYHPFPQRTKAETVRIALPPAYPAPGFSIGR